MKTGAIPVYNNNNRRSSSSAAAASHSLERNANFSVNQSISSIPGSSKLRERSVPRTVGMYVNSCEKLDLPMSLHDNYHDDTDQSPQHSAHFSKMQTPRSTEHKSKLVRPKTSMQRQKKDSFTTAETTSKLPTPSVGTLSPPPTRITNASTSGKENHQTYDTLPRLKVEALNDKNTQMNDFERVNSNASINSCGFKSRLVKPSTSGNAKPSGIARPRATSKLSRPSSPESVNRSLEDVLGTKAANLPSHQTSSTYSSKKKFGSAEGILSPSKESKTMNAMKALMNDVENHLKFRADLNDSSFEATRTRADKYSSPAATAPIQNFEEEKASGEINKNGKPEKIYSKMPCPEGKVLKAESKSNLLSPSIGRKLEGGSVSKVPRMTSQLPKSKLPSLNANKFSYLPRCSMNSNSSDHSKRVVSSSENLHQKEEKADEVFNLEEIHMNGRRGSSFNDRSATVDVQQSMNIRNGEKQQNNHLPRSPEQNLEKPSSIGSDSERLSAYDIKPMAPLLMSSPYFPFQNLTPGTPSLSNGSTHQKMFRKDHNFLNHDYQDVQPSTAATAGSFHKSKNNLTNSFDQDYCDAETGYMSDGDLLSNHKNQGSSGYTSDCGASFHSRGKHLASSRLKILDDNYENICDENFDGCSSLSSSEDANSIYSTFAVGRPQPTSTDRCKTFLKADKIGSDNENFERASRGRSTMPVKGRRAILPIGGFVKKAQEQSANAIPDLEESEIDVKVTYENNINSLKKNLTASDSIINEGMIDLDQVMSDYGSRAQTAGALSNLSQFSSTISEPKDYSFGLSSHPSNFSLLSQYSVGDNKSLFGGRKDGGASGSKFGMSLEQCYNSGVFRRRDKSDHNNADNVSISTSEGSDRSQTMGKTLSVASDGDQGLPFGSRVLSPAKVNPYATMSRSQMASRVANKMENAMKQVGNECGDMFTPLISRRSDTSMYPGEDTTSVASFPSFKLRLANQLPSYKNLPNSSPIPPPPPLLPSDSNSSMDRKIYSPSGYMLSRSGSQHASGFNSSRPPSTNGNGSTLSLGSCSSLYSTAEEYHAQEIRRLRHELETAHSRVASLNMQLNINESVVQAFEQSISNLNHRLQQLSLLTTEKDPDVRDLKTSLDQFGAFEKNSINFNQNTIPEDCTSLASINQHQELEKKKRQKKWLMSFGKAFFRKKNKMSHLESNLVIETASTSDEAHNISSSMTREPGEDPIIMLEQKLHEKEMKLTDVQLEALSSAHQLDQLRDNMVQMEKEMMCLRMDNTRLKQLVTQKTGDQPPSTTEKCGTTSTSSSSSQPPSSPSNQNESNAPLSSPISPDVQSNKSPKHRKIILSIQLTHTNHSNQLSVPETKSSEIMFGKLYLTENMGWETLNRSVAKKFQNYLKNVDPEDGLGLDQSSINTLHIGDITWHVDGPYPPMSPSSYLVGFNKSISMVLKGVEEDRLDSLSFETMIPRPILERYISLMMEFRRVIFCGPSGTGKTYLALKLAQYMSDRLAKEEVTPTMSVFNVDHKSSKELRQYLSNISSNSSAQHNVIVLDNLHHVVSLADVFNGFLSMGNQNSPYVIGTMNQVSSSATNLQLHHMFRWVLYSNHIKPVSGFLGRFLRRHLMEREVLGEGTRGLGGDMDVDGEDELKKTIDWIPKVWQHVNRLLETHNSSEVTLGPQLYLSCPMGGSLMKLWFTDLWNYSIFPYLMEAIKDGIQTYGCRAAWEDPTEWVEKSCPWSTDKSSQLLHLRPEDVGYDAQQQSSDNTTAPFHAINNNLDSNMLNNQTPCKVSSDPLLNMLLRLQEFSNNNNNNNNSKENLISSRDCV